MVKVDDIRLMHVNALSNATFAPTTIKYHDNTAATTKKAAEKETVDDTNGC